MKFPKHLLLALLTLCFAHSQILAQNTDLRIDFTGTQPAEVSVGSSFAITAQLSLDVNGTTAVPSGEVVTAILQLKSPDGLILATHTETWNGFPEAGRSNILDNDPRPEDQVIFQIPWSEAQKWTANAQWSITASVGGAAAENDLSDNEVIHTFNLRIPNLEVTNLQTSGTYRPGSQVTANVTVENTGQVRTQEGVFFPLVVRLLDASDAVLDQETVILPSPDLGLTPSLEPNQAEELTITNLRIPEDATVVTVQAVVDPTFAFQGHIVHETVEDSDLVATDNRQEVTLDIGLGNAQLQVDPDSFDGDMGTFRGLDPARLSFTVRNEGTAAIANTDDFTVQALLSEDDSYSTSDFILREFDFGGNALGTNLLPNETVSLDWIQQMPDNFEGDYYLLIRIIDGAGVDTVFVMDNTPTISLVSNNRGSTHLLVESNQQSTERPQSSADGQFVVYEETDNAGIQQIYFLDVLGNGAPELVSRNFQSNTATLGANSNSYRPRISSDGSSIVFHSRASDLVPGDLNDHEDVFLYRTASQQLIRAYDANANTEPNNGSFYPDINGDGTKIVFESEATNLQSDTVATTGRQIFLWDLSNGGRIRALTSGDGKSNGVTIDDSGTTVAFSSSATNLVANDDNSLTDVFVTKLAQTVDANDTTYLANLPSVNVDPSGNTRALGGKSDQAEISGDGSTIVYRSMATNLVTLKGISMIEVVNGGAGYFGNPTIVVTDQGGTGSGATLSLANAIDVYGQLLPGGPTILSHGENYTNPVITIVSDPTQAAPAQQAVLEAHITHPQGELYLIKLADIDGTNLVPEYSKRISERNGVGGSMASRDPSISYDGETVVYATKSSNLLDGNVTREDGATFYNTPVTQATAQAILVGGIGEIEVQSAGSGYQSGFLKIEDYSGGGSGAIASYQVDSLGRISSITMVETGSGYRLETTVISVDNPRGGTGFVAGEARFPQAGGIGANRSGGGSVHRVEMITPGSGYQQLSNTSFGAQALFSIDGDGVDVDSNGVADAKINPSRVHLDTQGGVYLEQKFDVEIVSTTSLATTVLTIGDANRTITVDFATNAALPFTIGLTGNDLSGIRDDLIGIIQTQWSSPTDLLSGPQIDDNSSGGTSFVLSGLSGTFTANNPTSVSITAQSNLLFSGSGFTRATPVIAPPPVIHGFSEILSSTSTTAAGNSRELESVQIDETTDDIYIYDALTQRNERVSRSTFGFPVNFLPSSTSTMPSNRFPSISGDARHIFFSSDATADGGLAFSTSNQSPLDQNSVRDIYHHDRKLATVPSPLSPQPALQSPQPATALVLAEVNATDPDQGLSDNFTVLTGGNSYRYPPTVELEGGGGSGATAVAVLKHGVIRKIDVLNPGYGYDPLRVRIKILDNGVEHNGTSGKNLAILEPKFNFSNGIESIKVLDGGSGYHPSSSTLTVLVDYNGSSQGYGFEAGPVYTSDGIIDSVQLVNKGSGYQSAPSVKISGGGHEYPEGTPVHLRVVASEIAGIADVRLIANGNLQPNRPLGSATPTGGGGFVDVVMNEPYFDVFWIPDRNPATGIGGVDGLGLWQLEVEVEDSMGKVTRTQAIEVKVVNTSPPICNILTPEDNAVFILDPSSPISLIAEASDEDGIITEVQFLIDNANTGFQGTESYVVNRPPYKLDWVASAIGTYEIKAIAIDNGLISTISDPITITVQEPVGEKPIAGWHFPADYNRENNNDPFDFFFFFGPTNNNDVDNDYAIGSSIPLNVSAVDDGSIVSVEFFVDNESIGFATKRYGSVYSYIWQSSQSEPALVFAKITDDDGNVVRTEVKTFNFGSNLGTKPLVELKYARRASGGNYEVNVMLKDIVQRNFFNRQDGDLHLNLLINGVQVSGSGSDPSNGLVNLGFETTNNPGDFFYNFSGIQLQESGFLDFQVVLRSRQGRNNYAQTIVSNTFQLYVQDYDDGVTLDNISPSGSIVSPGSKEFGRIVAILDDLSPTTGSTDVGLKELTPTQFGSSYTIAPEVIISGGGGSGAAANARILDGAITTLSFEKSAYQGDSSIQVLSQGMNYQDGDLIFAEVIPTAFDYNKSVDYSDGDTVQYPIPYDSNKDYADEERVLYDSKVWKKIGTQGGAYLGASLSHSIPSESNSGEWEFEPSFPLYWKKVGDQTAGQYSAPGTTTGITQWEMAFYAEIVVDNGVLDGNQSFDGGAILSKGTGYSELDEVEVVDISTGNGARAYVSKVDANGGVLEITVYRGGKDYNSQIAYLEIKDSNGNGFQSGNLSILNGVISSYAIKSPGENYVIPSSGEIQMITNSNNGIGFDAYAGADDLTQGALMVNLKNKGSGYTTSPIVTLQGGTFDANVEGRKKPMQVTAESPVYLLADALDLDGYVGSVKFYGDGEDLSLRYERQITEIELLNAGTGYTQPPNVIIEGGGGTGATAVAVLVPAPQNNNNQPRSLSRVFVTSPGSDYFATPTVRIESTNGRGAGAVGRAIVEEQVREVPAYESVPGTGRWVLEWIPSKPGTYLIDLEISDLDGLSTFYTTQNQIIVLPKQISQKPSITLGNEHHGNAYTTLSNLRFTARANDSDGALVGVQFYVNGDLLGAEIPADYAESQSQQPYSAEFSPPVAGVYTVYAIARDNSGNHVMSQPVTFTCTTGAGQAPIIRLSKPTMAAEGNASIVDGKIEKISLSLGGTGYTTDPDVKIYGSGDGAKYLANIDLNATSPTYSQVISVTPETSGDDSQGVNYESNTTTIAFEGGFSQLNASGRVATAEFGTTIVQNQGGQGQARYLYSINLTNGGSGYVSDPRVAFLGAPPGMQGVASTDPVSGRVTFVTITNQGDNTALYPNPRVFLSGGLSYSEILIEAFAEDGDDDGYITEVSFYVNGQLINDANSLDTNPDSRAPYQILWSPEGPGIYELFATAEDSDGNLVTSPIIRREAVISKPPTLEFNPRDRAFGYLDPDLLDENGTIRPTDTVLGTLANSLVSNGSGYHSLPSVEFISYDDLGNRVSIPTEAEALATFQDGLVTSIQLLKGNNGDFLGGEGYRDYRKLTGTVSIRDGSDLLIGNETEFFKELVIGQPLLLVEEGKIINKQNYLRFAPLSFQSNVELILDKPFDLNGSGETKTFDLYTFGTEIVLGGGMETSSTPINLRQGSELALGVRVEDPEGKAIRADNFRAIINGVEDDTVAVQGSGPFYKVLWNPPDLGSYSIRLQVGDVDGAKGISQPLDVRVSAGLEPIIRMVSPINEGIAAEGQASPLEYALGTSLSFTYEAKDFDGVIDYVLFYANSRQVGRWPLLGADNNGTRREGLTNRYTQTWTPSYPGEYTISASATDNSGMQAFSKTKTFTIKASYKDGSLPPINKIVYPKEKEQDDPSPQQPTFHTPAYTSASVIPIIANGYDQDGSLENLYFYVDGELIPSRTAYLQMVAAPRDGETFTIDDGIQGLQTFEFDADGNVTQDNESISLSPIFEDVSVLKTVIESMHSGTLTQDLESSFTSILEKYGTPRLSSPSVDLLEQMTRGIEEDAFDEQRNLILSAIQNVSDQNGSGANGLQVKPEIIGFNGIMLRHGKPNELSDSSTPSISKDSQATSFNVKGFAKGLLRFPSRDSKEYHFTQLWTPPTAGVYTIVAISEDTSGNRIMSSPVTLTSTYGEDAPTVKMTSPLSGTQRSVELVGRPARGTAYQVVTITNGISRFTGEIGGVELLTRGSGYVAPPEVRFVGAGFGAAAEATIVLDPANPRFGEIEEITITAAGQGYFGQTDVEFIGGLGNEALFLNATAEDSDGEIDGVTFLRNGVEIASDLTEPFALQDIFSVGYYELVALAKDDAGNVVASEPARMNISTIRGAAPSGFMIYPLPQQARNAYNASQSQDYFWDFARNYSSQIQQAETNLTDVSAGNSLDDIIQNSEELAANSFIHLSARATDSDGQVKEVTFYLNNKYLGTAERQHDSHHFVLPVDLSDFGEQPVYRIDTMIRDQAENIRVPNNPVYLNVLPATGSRPDIEIILPDPNATSIPKYSVGGQVSLVVDATPKEGTLEAVSLYANGRFIGEAQLQNDLSYGKQRYALNWTPENSGMYNLSASVRDRLGVVIFTQTPSVVEIAEDDFEIITNIEIVPTQVAASNNAVARGSSLLANVDFLGPEGKPLLMKDVKFYLNGSLIDTQDQSPFSFLFRPPSLQDRFVEAPLSWEIKAVGQSLNDFIGTAISTGTVLGVTELPQLRLSPVEGPSSLPDKYLYDGMNLSLSVLAEGRADALTSINQVVLYGNGVEIMAGIPTFNLSEAGNLQSITYEFDWLVDFDEFSKSDGTVRLVALADLAGDPTGFGSLPVISSNTEEVLVQYEGSQSLGTLFTQVTGETLSTQDIDEILEDMNATSVTSSTYDPVEALITLVNNSDRLSQRVDVTAAYHITLGQWHDSFSAYQNHTSNFIPFDALGTQEWLKDYIDYLLTSADEGYLARFGSVPYLVGDESKKGSQPFADNRMDFVQQCLFNKYSVQPTFQQVFQGSNRMLSFWSQFEPNYWEVRGATGTANVDSPPRRDTNFFGATGFGAGECAVDLIFNLAKEIKYEGGLPYILYTLDQRELYRIVTYYLLYFGENLSEVNANEIEYLGSLGEKKALDEILNDWRWTSQSNQIWKNSPTLSLDYWKSENWFGPFMDKYFPWTFHSSLGWIYVQGNNPMEFWFYSSNQNSWYWTGATIYPYAYSSEKSGWVYFDTNTGMLYDFNEAKWAPY